MKKSANHVHTVSAHMVTVHQIVFAAANHFYLPLERGYDVEIVDAGPKNSYILFTVTAPEWGDQSNLSFGLEKDMNGFWYPAAGWQQSITLGHANGIPSGFRGSQYRLEIDRILPNERKQWPAGRYPRYRIRKQFIARFGKPATM